MIFLEVVEKKLTKCQHAREIANITMMLNRSSPYALPSCDKHGNFEKVQCAQSLGVCWCSTPEGKPIPGTLTAGNPDCSIKRNFTTSKHLFYDKIVTRQEIFF